MRTLRKPLVVIPACPESFLLRTSATLYEEGFSPRRVAEETGQVGERMVSLNISNNVIEFPLNYPLISILLFPNNGDIGDRYFS